MLNLDPRSIILMTGVMSLLMAGMLAVMRRGYPQTIKGLNLWIIAMVVAFLGGMLVSAYGKLPGILTSVLGNTAVLYGVVLSYQGSRRFAGQASTHRFWIVVVLGCAAAFAWFTYAQPSYLIRVQIFTVAVACNMLAHALTLWRAEGRNYFCKVGAVVLALQIMFLMVRMVTLALDNGTNGVFDPSSSQILHLMGYAFAGLLLSLSQVLMASESMRAAFEHVATHDHLTGALSRGALIEACEQELERCQRHDRVMTLLMMDLDNFKVINDTYGHLTGDRVLVDFVNQVKQQLRRPDCLGRFGGEEFVVLLPETAKEVALQVAERIRASVQSHPADAACTVSIGVATSQAGTETLDQLIARADSALYRAKAAGRNCIEAA
jgi:diguanylate cyclase (GGDEF)-like protein